MIIELTRDNFDKYADQIVRIYVKRFKVKYSVSDLEKHLNDSKIFIYVNDSDNNKVLGFMRIKYISTRNKYLKHFKFRKAIFLSDIAVAVSNKGIGTKLMKFLIRLSDKLNLPIITIPAHDGLLKYYTKYGFSAYYFDDKILPKVVLIRPPKNKLFVKPEIESLHNKG